MIDRLLDVIVDIIRPATANRNLSRLFPERICTSLRWQIGDDGFGLAAFLPLSGILARLQASGLNSPDDTRLLLDSAILTLENMPIQEEPVQKARVARSNERLLVLPGGKDKRRP